MEMCEFDENILKRLQSEEMNILEVVDEFCKIHGLRYSLMYGSMLGAKRHQGFIPWDDDMDIFMTRVDYDKFICEWQKDPPKGYVLQNNDLEPSFKQSFTKVHKNGTIFLTKEAINEPYHHGIRIDIFPVDVIPNSRIKQTVQRLDALFAMLFTRGYVSKSNGKLMYYVGCAILGCIPKRYHERVKKIFQKRQTKYNYTLKDYKKYCAFDVLADFKVQYPREWIETIDEVSFEGRYFSCYRNSHEMLTMIYGDYMQYPPNEQQTWTHHPLSISFDSTYPSDERFEKN